MGKTVVSAESAEKQLHILKEHYDFDEDDIPAGVTLESMKMTFKKLTKAVMDGRLEITRDKDELKVVQNLKTAYGDTTKLEYEELCGRHKVAMKGKETNDLHSRMYALVGSMTGTSEASIMGLKGADLSLCECIGAFFLNV